MRVKNQPVPTFALEASEDEVNNGQADEPQDDNQIDDQIENQNFHQQYSFEDQFKQLYELSPDPERKEFLDDLFLFMTKRGTPVNRIPIMAKQVLDLFELYRLVVSHGGLVEVINKKIWREITKGLSLPSSITSAAFTLRTQYMKYLYPYECERENLSTPEELQQAIDGNKREGRRSSHGNFQDMMGSPVASGSGYSDNSLPVVNRSSGIAGPSNGNIATHNIPASLSSAAALSYVARHLNAVNNSGSSSGEEDNGPVQPLSLNPLFALASGQAEALNLEVKPNGRRFGMNNSMANKQNNNSSSSLNSISSNLENETNSVNVNNSGKDSNNNNTNGRDRNELSKRINNPLVNGHREEPRHDPGINLSARNPSLSSSSSSTIANNGNRRNLSDDEKLLVNPGMPAVNIRILNQDERGSLENSLLLSMEINNNYYQGILYPRSFKP